MTTRATNRRTAAHRRHRRPPRRPRGSIPPAERVRWPSRRLLREANLRTHQAPKGGHWGPEAQLEHQTPWLRPVQRLQIGASRAAQSVRDALHRRLAHKQATPPAQRAQWQGSNVSIEWWQNVQLVANAGTEYSVKPALASPWADEQRAAYRRGAGTMCVTSDYSSLACRGSAAMSRPSRARTGMSSVIRSSCVKS